MHNKKTCLTTCSRKKNKIPDLLHFYNNKIKFMFIAICKRENLVILWSFNLFKLKYFFDKLLTTRGCHKTG